MKILKYMDKSLAKKFLLMLGIILIIVVGIFGKGYLDNFDSQEVIAERNQKTYMSDFCKDSVVDKCVNKLKGKLRNIKNRNQLLDVLLKYYKDTVDDHFGENSGSSSYNKVNNTINISIESPNISKEELLKSDYEIQNEWNSIISKMANFTRNTKGIINELTNYDINIQIDIVDKETNDIIGTVNNGKISYSII